MKIRNIALLMSCLFSLELLAQDIPMSQENIDFLDNLPGACITPKNLSQSPDKVGAIKLSGDHIANRFIVDGPANLLDIPKGKIIHSFRDKLLVLVQARKGDWFFVSGFQEENCDEGWIHKNNIRAVTQNEVNSIELESFNESDKVSKLWKQAYKSYLVSGDIKAAETLSLEAIKSAEACKYPMSSMSDCAKGLHFASLLVSKIHFDRKEYDSAEEFLMKASLVTCTQSMSMGQYNMEVAKLFLDIKKNDIVINYLNNISKCWKEKIFATKDSVRFSPEGSYPIPTWIEAIKNRKPADIDRFHVQEWVWKKESWP